MEWLEVMLLIESEVIVNKVITLDVVIKNVIYT